MIPGTVGCTACAERVRRTAALAAAALGLMAALGLPAAADADENGGIVIGSVTLAPAEQRGATPVRNQGFVRRVPALKPPRAVDPRPHIIIVLDGATPPEEDRQPPGQPVAYTIVGESFDVPLLPVVAGSVVEIRNAGRGAPRLYSPGQADFVPPDPISPRGERKTRKIEPAHQTFELRDRESVHLSGRIVGFPHRYIARVARRRLVHHPRGRARRVEGARLVSRRLGPGAGGDGGGGRQEGEQAGQDRAAGQARDQASPLAERPHNVLVENLVLPGRGGRRRDAHAGAGHAASGRARDRGEPRPSAWPTPAASPRSCCATSRRAASSWPARRRASRAWTACCSSRRRARPSPPPLTRWRRRSSART